MVDTRDRILDVAVEVLGRNPDAGMGEVAAAAGVVRRTVYGHFPTRTDLVLALTGRAVAEMVVLLDEESVPGRDPDEVWAGFVARLWPLVHRYRVLVALRRGALGEGIHAQLGPIEDALADLVRQGQRRGAFGRHLPAEVLSAVAWSVVFSVADADLPRGRLDAGSATTASLLVLGVDPSRVAVLAEPSPKP